MRGREPRGAGHESRPLIRNGEAKKKPMFLTWPQLLEAKGLLLLFG